MDRDERSASVLPRLDGPSKQEVSSHDPHRPLFRRRVHPHGEAAVLGGNVQHGVVTLRGERGVVDFRVGVVSASDSVGAVSRGESTGGVVMAGRDVDGVALQIPSHHPSRGGATATFE